MRDDAVLWLCIGDSFATNPGNGRGGETVEGGTPHRSASDKTGIGYAPGSLLGIPGLLHQAALGDGWVVRDNFPWIKTAPMPESIRGIRYEKARCGCVGAGREAARKALQAQTGLTRETAYAYLPHGDTIGDSYKPDPACPTCGGTGRLAELVLRRGSWRHTRATETILQLTNGMACWSNGEAVRESATNGERFHGAYASGNRTQGSNGRTREENSTASRNPRGAFLEPPSPAADLAALVAWLTQHCPEVLAAYQADAQNPAGVLRPKPSALGLQHYAAYPPDLVKRLILATCPERVCTQCGAGWSPVISDSGQEDISHKGSRFDVGKTGVNGNGRVQTGLRTSKTATGELRPTCPHYCTCATPEACTCGKLSLAAYGAGVCLDPFVGSGTTLEVARALGRCGVGLDLSATYLREIARERLGLSDLAAWEGRNSHRPAEAFADLPLFGGG